MLREWRGAAPGPDTSRPGCRPCAAPLSRRTSQGVPCKVRRRFFRISFLRFSRTFSAHRRENSICFDVTTLAPTPLGVPAAAALTQFRNVYSTSPNSLAAAPAVSPSLTCVTVNFLNSEVYCCLGICIVSSFMVTAMIRHPWKRKFWRKLTSH